MFPRICDKDAWKESGVHVVRPQDTLDGIVISQFLGKRNSIEYSGKPIVSMARGVHSLDIWPCRGELRIRGDVVQPGILPPLTRGWHKTQEPMFIQ
jgi:hypothetical protein